MSHACVTALFSYPTPQIIHKPLTSRSKPNSLNSTMASTELRQRPKNEDNPTTTTTTSSKDMRMAMAKRGLRSLGIAVAIPLFLTAAATFLCGATRGFATERLPFWQPPRWLFHLASLSTTSLMGLAAWLVWADGGFRRQPVALPLYLGQFLVGLAWAPLVFGYGAMKAGLGACLLMFLALLGCCRTFGKVNPIAADLAKPCLAWVAFLTLFNYKLI